MAVDADFGRVVAAHLHDWQITSPDPDAPHPAVWVEARPAGAAFSPSQGWKLHVSATIWSAMEVLDRVLPVLREEDAHFKVAVNGMFLARLNSGMQGHSQVGKFMTVYPASDDAAVRLATRLCAATEGLPGPDVPSDRRLGDAPVHYRYGAFDTSSVQNALGQPQLGVVDPDGRGEVDHRGTSFRKPTWVDDPFEAAGLVEPLAPPEREHIVDGRFLRLVPLTIAARGTVYRGVDLHRGARAVIKLAHRDAALGLDGRDAATRLAHEGEVLAAVGATTSAPELYGTGVWQEQVYVAMEEIVGRPASWHVQTARFDGTVLDADRARRWGVDIARALHAVHEAGYVYRDVKLANVMIDDGADRARLIDFELAAPIGAAAGQGEAGSRGYTAPRLDVRTVTVADDVFGFGALLWALAVSTEPSLQPDENDLDHLEALLLNPDADEGLLAISSWCRQRDPADRPASMEQVLGALTAGPAAPVARRVRPSNPPPWEQLAVRAGDALVDRRVGDAQFALWPSVRRYGHGMALRTTYEGAAGVVLALAALVDAGHDRFAEVLRMGCRWLIDGDDGVDHVIGLHTGEMGVAGALTIAGSVLGDEDVVAAGAKLAASFDLGEGALNRVGPDYVAGAAGLARGNLIVHRATGDPAAVTRAVDLAEWLDAQAIADERGVLWTLPDDVPRIGGQASLGYGHGAAGIADVLLDVADATGDERWRSLADRALDLVAAAAVERPNGLDWPELDGGDAHGGWWCHGAGGISLVLGRAGRKDLARRGADHTAQMTWGFPNRCHGLAGNVEILLAAAEALDAPELVDAARRHGRLLAAWEIGPGQWPGESPELVTPDYMVGLAGVIPAFLRLAGHPSIDPTLIGFR